MYQYITVIVVPVPMSGIRCSKDTADMELNYTALGRFIGTVGLLAVAIVCHMMLVKFRALVF